MLLQSYMTLYFVELFLYQLVGVTVRVCQVVVDFRFNRARDFYTVSLRLFLPEVVKYSPTTSGHSQLKR